MDVFPPSLPRISEGMVPLKDVIQHVVYYAFSELQNILEILPSMTNILKKRTMLEYLLLMKRQMIKLYVLIKWTHDSEDVKKCIDIVAFLQGQKNCFLNVVHALKTIVHQISYARLRSPDISTAMEVFSTGTFPRLKLSKTYNAFVVQDIPKPSEVLQTFNKLNVLISMRLALYQVIPYSMVFYIVENGRVKFIVENEFVIFLSFVGEDISKVDDFLWFLVDFEWNFRGAPAIDDDIKSEIEKSGNEVLKLSVIQKKEPLVELYNFLLIAMEAKEIAFGGWKDQLNVNFDHFKRYLTLKYWPVLTSEKNIKSWPNSIEIFIGESKKKNIAAYMFSYSRVSFDYDCSVITYSWKIGDDFQCCDDLNIDESTISAKEIIFKIINAHSMMLLKKIYSTLLKSDSFSTDSVFILTTNENNENPVLKIQCSKAKSILIFVKFMCGTFKLMEYDSLLCSSMIIKNYEKLINIPNQNILEILIRLKCKILYNDIESKAKFLGWDIAKFLPGSFKQKEFQDNFGLEIKYAIFLTNHILGWKETSTSVFFVVSFLSGRNANWWLLEASASNCDVFLGWNILWSEKIRIYIEKKRKFDELDLPMDSDVSPTYSLLESIYKYSIIRVAILRFSRDFDRRCIRYGYLHELSISQLWIIPFFYFCTRDISPMAEVWVYKNMFVQFSFSEHSFDELKIIFYGKLVNINFLERLLCQYKKDGIELNVKSNYFLIKVMYKMNKNISSVIDLFFQIWLKIETIIRLVFKSNEFNHFLILEDFNINTVRFSYYKKKHFWLEIAYDTNDQKAKFPIITYSLKIGANDGYINPHNRIKIHLSQILEESCGNILLFSEIVYKTLPFLETIEQLELASIEKSEFHVLFQSSLQFSIIYLKKRYALGIILRSIPSHLLHNDMIELNEGTLVYYIFDLALKYQEIDILESSQMIKGQDFKNDTIKSESGVNIRARNLNCLKSMYNVIGACQSIWRKGMDVEQEYKKAIFSLDNGLFCTSDVIGYVINKIHTIILEQGST
ncbi:hypothetical protein PCANB_001340 [Pneumocystis canis]|nr:hypothetical protein PCANB_001340 [Pneumocystis canis]